MLSGISRLCIECMCRRAARFGYPVVYGFDLYCGKDDPFDKEQWAKVFCLLQIFDSQLFLRFGLNC